MPVYCEVEGLSQVRFGSVEFDFDGLEAVLGVFQLGADPVLFGLEQLEGDSIGVVGFEELASFVFECAYAAFLNEVGVPAVCFGPGDTAQAHTQDEWIDVREIRTCAKVLETFARGLVD